MHDRICYITAGLLLMLLIPGAMAGVEVKITDWPDNPVTGTEVEINATYNITGWDTSTISEINAKVNWSFGSVVTPVEQDDEFNGTLSANYTFVNAGEYQVIVNVTVKNETLTEYGEDKVLISVDPVSIGEVVVKPETLNLKSKGIFTVFLNVADLYEAGELTDVMIAGAEVEKTHFCMKDGGTYILKFRRQDLVSVESGDGVELNITGDVDGYEFKGNDTLRVINPGNGNKAKNEDTGTEDTETATVQGTGKGLKPDKGLKIFKNNNGKAKGKQTDS
jgi:hypothetical protein